MCFHVNTLLVGSRRGSLHLCLPFTSKPCRFGFAGVLVLVYVFETGKLSSRRQHADINVKQIGGIH